MDIEAVIFHIPYQQTLAIDETHFIGKNVKEKAVLVHTGWDKFWKTEDYFTNHPFLTEGAASYLKECGVKLVGIGSHNIDDTRGRSRPVHSVLLQSEILIVEHLCNLENIPDVPFTFSAVPPKIKGLGTFPVRAYAKIK